MGNKKSKGTSKLPTLGYKVWSVSKGKLYPVLSPKQAPWSKSNPEHAECTLHGPLHTKVHSAPSLACTCGIHAFYSLNSALEFASSIQEICESRNYKRKLTIGVVALSGQKIEEKEFIRSASAKIIGIFSHRFLKDYIKKENPNFVFPQNRFKSNCFQLNLFNSKIKTIHSKKQLKKITSSLQSAEPPYGVFPSLTYEKALNDFISSAKRNIPEKDLRLPVLNVDLKKSSVNRAALGFRNWDLVPGDRLNGVFFKSTPFAKGVNKANCHKCARSGAKLPDEEHDCGFNAYDSISSAYRSYCWDSNVITGAVAGFGKMRIHVNGWRSEKAQLIALAVIDKYYKEKIDTQLSKALNSDLNIYLNYINHLFIARRYNVPVFVVKDSLYEYTTQIAIPIPPRLKPV